MGWRAEQSRRQRNSLDKSFHVYATYLCQEVFANMSDLPLIIPSKISCFSGGSFAEELARRRDLPVPPLPRRSGALARSEDNLTGVPPPSRITRPSARLTRHSSYTWLQGDRASTKAGRKQTDRQRSLEEMPVVPSAHNDGDEKIRQVPSEQVLPVKFGRDEEDQTFIFSSDDQVIDGPSEQAEQIICCSDDQVRCEPSEQVEQTICSSEDQVRHKHSEQAEQIICTRHEWIEQSLPAICSREHNENGGFEIMMDENSDTIQVDTDEQAINSESKIDIKSCSEGQNVYVSESSSKMNLFEKFERKSTFGTAIDRLSFRFRRKKDKNKTKCDEKIPKKEVVNPSETKDIDEEQNEEETAKKIVDEQTKEFFKTPYVAESTTATPALPICSSTYLQSRPISHLAADLRKFKLSTAKSRDNLSMSRPNISIPDTITQPRPASSVTKTCPPTPSTRWRQKPPPANNYLECQWKKLSASMISIRHSGQEELSLAKTNYSVTSSNHSLAAAGVAVPVQKVAEEEGKMTRAVSVSVLDNPRAGNRFQIPSNQMMQMNQYQRRVQVSMEKLNVPSWYNPPNTPASSSAIINPSTTFWKQAGGSSLSSAGWRRHISHSSSPSTTSTLERKSTPLSSQRYKSRFGTFSSSTRSPSRSSIISSSSSISSTPSKPSYLGWRSQDRLDSGPAYLTSPAQRLASSVAFSTAGRQAGAEGTGTGGTNQEGTEDSLEYCKSSLSEKPPQVKEAWPQLDSESDDSTDNMDDDSGIDRSDDFRQEILDEE